MTLSLKSLPGLDSSKALSIPKDWSAAWYRDHINNLLKGADVRNAVGANGITISGNIASPYGTVGLGPVLTFGTQTSGTTVSNSAFQSIIQYGNAFFASSNTKGSTWWGSNLYYDGTNYRYETNGIAGLINFNNNSTIGYQYLMAPIGVAGAIATLSEYFRMNAPNGGVQVNVTADDLNAIIVNEIAGTVTDGTTMLLQQYNGANVGWFGFGLASSAQAANAGDLVIEAGSAVTASPRMLFNWGYSGPGALIALNAPGGIGAGTVAPTLGPWSGGVGAVAQVAMDLGNCGIMTYPATGGTAGTNLYLVTNASYNGSSWIYKTASSAGAALFSYSGTGFAWYLAPAGSAGTAASFVQCLSINAAGQLAVSNNQSPALAIIATPAASLYGLAINSGTSAGYAAISLNSGNTFNVSDFELYQSGTAAVISNGNSGNLSISTGGNVNISSNGTIGISVQPAGVVKFFNISTTASAANAFIDNANSNNLLRSTSSRRYKRDIYAVTDPSAILALKPIVYKSKAAADDPNREFYGLIAEDVFEVDPRLVHLDEKGAPDGVQYDRVTVLLLAYIQKLHRQLADAGITIH